MVLTPQAAQLILTQTTIYVKILKGGAASALYGVRASNGVILIETKSGKGLNKAKVEFSSTFTVDRVSNFLQDKQHMLKETTAHGLVVFPEHGDPKFLS